MKCVSCGAEIGSDRICKYCGCQISEEMIKENEAINKKRCNKCGSTNIEYKREKVREIKNKNGKQTIYNTVAICKDCGATWDPNKRPPQPADYTWLWVIGWIFAFPIPLTIVMSRNKKINNKAKIWIVLAGWVVYFFIAFWPCLFSIIKGNVNFDVPLVSSISFYDTTSTTIEVGKTTSRSYSDYVEVKVSSSSDFTLQDIIGVSDNPEVATIDFIEEGTTSKYSLNRKLYYSITGVSKGETYVYVKAKEGSAVSEKIKVTVIGNDKEINEISIEPESVSLTLRETITLDPHIEPYSADDTRLVWSSSDENVATVDTNGTVTAVGDGSAIITVKTENDLSASVDVNVDASKTAMILKITRPRDDDNNIGEEWSFHDEINGEIVRGGTYAVSAGDKLTFYSEYSEEDNNPDIGSATTTYIVKEEDLTNGFEIKMDVNVTENGGMNSGQSAHYTATYTFTPQ